MSRLLDGSSHFFCVQGYGIKIGFVHDLLANECTTDA